MDYFIQAFDTKQLAELLQQRILMPKARIEIGKIITLHVKMLVKYHGTLLTDAKDVTRNAIFSILFKQCVKAIRAQGFGYNFIDK